MKSLRKVLVIFLLSLNGCAVSGKVWNTKYYNESFKNYFIDEENNRIVLIGENKMAYDVKENYHYYVKDNDRNIKKVFEIGARSKDLSISLGHTQARGSRIITSLGLGFDKKNLLNNEIIFLHKNQFIDGKIGSKIGHIYRDSEMVRYPASKEPVRNYKLISLNFKEEVRFWEENTPLQTTGKVLLTPFTLAIDALLLPITVPYFIYHQVKES